MILLVRFLDSRNSPTESAPCPTTGRSETNTLRSLCDFSASVPQRNKKGRTSCDFSAFVPQRSDTIIDPADSLKRPRAFAQIKYVLLSARPRPSLPFRPPKVVEHSNRTSKSLFKVAHWYRSEKITRGLAPKPTLGYKSEKITRQPCWEEACSGATGHGNAAQSLVSGPVPHDVRTLRENTRMRCPTRKNSKPPAARPQQQDHSRSLRRICQHPVVDASAAHKGTIGKTSPARSIRPT